MADYIQSTDYSKPPTGFVSGKVMPFEDYVCFEYRDNAYVLLCGDIEGNTVEGRAYELEYTYNQGYIMSDAIEGTHSFSISNTYYSQSSDPDLGLFTDISSGNNLLPWCIFVLTLGLVFYALFPPFNPWKQRGGNINV